MKFQDAIRSSCFKSPFVTTNTFSEGILLWFEDLNVTWLSHIPTKIRRMRLTKLPSKRFLINKIKDGIRLFALGQSVIKGDEQLMVNTVVRDEYTQILQP